MRSTYFLRLLGQDSNLRPPAIKTFVLPSAPPSAIIIYNHISFVLSTTITFFFLCAYIHNDIPSLHSCIFFYSIHTDYILLFSFLLFFYLLYTPDILLPPDSFRLSLIRNNICIAYFCMVFSYLLLFAKIQKTPDYSDVFTSSINCFINSVILLA